MATSKFRRISAGVPSASVRPRSSTWIAVADLHDQRRRCGRSAARRRRSRRGPSGRRRRRRGSRPRAARLRARPSARSAAAARAPARRRASARRRAAARPPARPRARARPSRPSSSSARRRASRARRPGAERRHLDVLAHGEPAEEAPVLERPREPGPAAPVRRPARDVARRRARPVRDDGRSKPVRMLTSVVLPGAVRADQAERPRRARARGRRPRAPARPRTSGRRRRPGASRADRRVAACLQRAARTVSGCSATTFAVCVVDDLRHVVVDLDHAVGAAEDAVQRRREADRAAERLELVSFARTRRASHRRSSRRSS